MRISKKNLACCFLFILALMNRTNDFLSFLSKENIYEAKLNSLGENNSILTKAKQIVLFMYIIIE